MTARDLTARKEWKKCGTWELGFSDGEERDESNSESRSHELESV